MSISCIISNFSKVQFFLKKIWISFSGMPVYVYEEPLGELSSFLHTALQQTLSFNPHVTKDPNIACLFFVPVGG